MAKFDYTYVDDQGVEQSGEIEASQVDSALDILQQKGLTVASIKEKKEGKINFSSGNIDVPFFQRVSSKEKVILSRQIATLFAAQVSATYIFDLLTNETENPIIKMTLDEVSADLKEGSTMSEAFAKHPKVFGEFYTNMVRAGEESGKLDETFTYLADYLERNDRLTSKAKSAFVYPMFVIAVFLAVMILMLTVVIPSLGELLLDAGGELPFITRLVLGISDFLVQYGLFLLIFFVTALFGIIKYGQTEQGDVLFSSFKIKIPIVGNLYKMLYLSRISDNMHTMLLSGVPVVKTLEVTAKVVGNKVYETILVHSLDAVKNGQPLSKTLEEYEEIPGIMTQMIRVGEESGKTGKILDTLSGFYRREVENAVETVISVIEPAMIIILGVGVGFLMAAILLPILSITATI